MKTFLVYDLDTGLPIAVGEAIKAEWARVETAEETDMRAENLIAEEISLGRSVNFNETEACSNGHTDCTCVCIASICGVTTAVSNQTLRAI